MDALKAGDYLIGEDARWQVQKIESVDNQVIVSLTRITGDRWGVDEIPLDDLIKRKFTKE